MGVLIPDLTNPLFPPIMRGIENRLGDAAQLGDGSRPSEEIRLEQSLVVRGSTAPPRS